jgi:hypothetical protein
VWSGVASLLAFLGCATATPTAIPPSQELVGAQRAFSVLPMTDGWLEVPAEAGSDAALVLQHETTGVTVLVNVHVGADQSIDGIVSGRRALLGEDHEILSFSEERSFLAHSDFAPVSVARYRLRRPGSEGWFPVLIGTVQGLEVVIEILGLGGRPRELEALFGDILGGLRVPDGGARP